MVAPEDLAAAEAAFAAGYQADRERQAYYSARPGEGVPCGWDAPPDTSGRQPAGLGYSRPPRNDAVFVEAGTTVPAPLPVPEPFDFSAPSSVTGSSHGWGMTPGPDAGSPASSIVYAGLGDQPRRSLMDRILGRRH